MEKPQIVLHAENPLNYTVFDTKWVPISTKFVSLGTQAKGTGALQIFEIASGKVNLVSDVRSFIFMNFSCVIHLYVVFRTNLFKRKFHQINYIYIR